MPPTKLKKKWNPEHLNVAHYSLKEYFLLVSVNYEFLIYFLKVAQVLIWFNVSIYEMSYKPHYEFWQTRFPEQSAQKTPEKTITQVVPWTRGGRDCSFSSANELTPVLPPGSGLCKPHPSQRSMVHCYSCSCSPFQGKRRSWLNPTARSQKISADCWERRRVQTHPLNTDYRLIPQKMHRCPKKLESQAGMEFVVPVKSHNGLISLALSSENGLDLLRTYAHSVKG